MRKPGRNHSAAFKARVALERSGVRRRWRRSRPTTRCMRPSDGLEDGACWRTPRDLRRDVLSTDGKERIRELQAKIGELTMENSFLEGALGNSPARAESDD